MRPKWQRTHPENPIRTNKRLLFMTVFFSGWAEKCSVFQFCFIQRKLEAEGVVIITQLRNILFSSKLSKKSVFFTSTSVKMLHSMSLNLSWKMKYLSLRAPHIRGWLNTRFPEALNSALHLCHHFCFQTSLTKWIIEQYKSKDVGSLVKALSSFKCSITVSQKNFKPYIMSQSP